jgi:probable HAF family extracellular repeat protein
MKKLLQKHTQIWALSLFVLAFQYRVAVCETSQFIYEQTVFDSVGENFDPKFPNSHPDDIASVTIKATNNDLILLSVTFTPGTYRADTEVRFFFDPSQSRTGNSYDQYGTIGDATVKLLRQDSVVSAISRYRAYPATISGDTVSAYIPSRVIIADDDGIMDLRVALSNSGHDLLERCPDWSLLINGTFYDGNTKLPPIVVNLPVPTSPTPPKDAVFGDVFHVVDLGGGDGSSPYSINNKGQVVGRGGLNTGTNIRGPLLFNGDGRNNIELGGLPGNTDGTPLTLSPSSYGTSQATKIYDNGEIFGQVFLPDGTNHEVRFSGTGKDNIDLSAIYSTQYPGFSGIGRGADGEYFGTLNNDAILIGNQGNANIVLQGLKPNWYSGISGINKQGLVYGSSTKAKGNWYYDYPVVFNIGRPATNLDVYAVEKSYIADVNDLGVIVGNAYYGPGPFDNHAVIYSGTGYDTNDLGTLGGGSSDATAINNSGTIVGESRTPEGYRAGMVWKNGVMYDLNKLLYNGGNVRVTRARDINDSGEIIAEGSVNGVSTSLLLIPSYLYSYLYPPAPVADYMIKARPSPSSKGKALGSGNYGVGDIVTVKAVAKRGKKFVNWTENNRSVSRKAYYKFTVSRARNLIAHFR